MNFSRISDLLAKYINLRHRIVSEYQKNRQKGYTNLVLLNESITKSMYKFITLDISAGMPIFNF